MKLKTLTLLLLIGTYSYCQNYTTAIGIKSGYPGYGSLNIKHFSSQSAATDFLIGSNFSGTSKYFWAQCIFEYNKNIINTSGINWYIGAGPQVGYYTNGGYYHKSNGKTYSGMWGGVSGLVGIEYTFANIPLNMAIEGGPSVNLFPYLNIDGVFNIAIRYAIQ